MKHLIPGQAFRLANYVCHSTGRPTKGDGTAILVRRSMDHHGVPFPGLPHWEATAIQITLAGRPVKDVAVYLSPSLPLIKRDLSACLDGGLPILTAGNRTPNMWIGTWGWPRQGKLLRNYADRKSCLLYGPNSFTTIPYNLSAVPDVSDIVLTKNLVTPVSLTARHLSQTTSQCWWTPGAIQPS
jgi:hypothetical protein